MIMHNKIHIIMKYIGEILIVTGIFLFVTGVSDLRISKRLNVVAYYYDTNEQTRMGIGASLFAAGLLVLRRRKS